MPTLPPAQARRLFATAEVARLATLTPDGRPHLVPITFALHGDVLYTAVDAKPKTTTRLRRLRNIEADPRVSVLADHYEADWSRLWWCRADGEAAILGDPGETAAAVALLAGRYPQYQRNPPRGPVLRIPVARWTAWSSVTPEPDGPG